jgi:hypothetical protein
MIISLMLHHVFWQMFNGISQLLTASFRAMSDITLGDLLNDTMLVSMKTKKKQPARKLAN